MSDIAATNLVDDSGLFAAAFSRLANSDGALIIESPPRGARGHVYELFEQIQKGDSEFLLHIVKADQAVEAGLISSDFLIAERQRLGHLFPQYYEATFLEGSGNLFLVNNNENEDPKDDNITFNVYKVKNDLYCEKDYFEIQLQHKKRGMNWGGYLYWENIKESPDLQ